MPVQSNPGVQTTATVNNADGIDIRKHVRFGWSFEVTEAIETDAVFHVQSAPASEADPCVADDWEEVEEIATCEGAAEPGPQATVTIPAGTPVGTICSGTIPCRPNAFVRLVGASGDHANVSVVALRQGPKIG